MENIKSFGLAGYNKQAYCNYSSWYMMATNKI